MSMIEKASAVMSCAIIERKKIIRTIERYVLAISISLLVFVFILRIVDEKALAAGNVQIVEDEPVKAEVINVIADELHLNYDGATNSYVGYDIDSEAKAMARVLYGTAQGIFSTDAQKAICWLIVNRAESSLFPNSIEEVCAQDNQFMAYSDENPIVREYYESAREVLQVWHSNGIRPMSNDYLYLSWSSDEIALRTTYNIGSSTRYWRVQ